MNEEVKNEATEEQIISKIKFTNSKGEEIEMLEDDLNEKESKLVADYNNITQAIKDIDNTHLNSLVRQSLILNQKLLTDRLEQEFDKRDEETPQIITETKTIES